MLSSGRTELLITLFSMPECKWHSSFTSSTHSRGLGYSGDRNTVYGSKVTSIHSCMRDNSYRWLAGPAVLSTVNFVLRRGPWLDKHQVRSLGCLKLLMFNFRLKLLVGPLGTCIRHSPSLQMQMLDSAYGAMLCIWTTVFLVAWREFPAAQHG